MRNLAQYPITHQEKVDALKRSIDVVNEIDAEKCGGVTSAALAEALSDIERIHSMKKSDGSMYLLAYVDGTAVEVRPVKPWDVLTQARLDETYQPGSPSLPAVMHVYAVGTTPIQAVMNLGQRIGWGMLSDFQRMDPDKDVSSIWGFRFTADTTSMEAAGFLVPGGAVVTWWK